MTPPNLSRAIEGFLLHQGACGRSPNTIRNQKQDLIKLMVYVGDRPLDEICTKELEEYFIFLKNDFRITHLATTPIPPRKLSNKSISNVHGTLAVFWKWSSKEYHFSNPFTLPPIRFHTKPILPLTNAEIERMLQGCKTVSKNPKIMSAYKSTRNTYKRDKAILLTLLDTGIRVSELCTAKIKDIDLEIGRLFVTGKGNKSRYVYLGKVSRQAIWSYIAERFPSSKPFPEEPIFLDRNKINGLTRQGVLELLRRIGDRAQVVNVHPHRFRHTFAIEFLRNGGNVFELQQLLGHSDLETAKKYVSIAQTDLETSIRKASPVDRWNIRL